MHKSDKFKKQFPIQKGWRKIVNQGYDNFASIEFLDTENMGVATKIMTQCVSQAEI